MNNKGSMKRDLIVFLCIILIALVIFIAKAINEAYDRYDIGDYGVSIKVPTIFTIDKEDEENLLSLCTENNEIVIKAKDIKGDFWSSDEMDDIMDKYIRLISAMRYDSSIYDVSLEKRKVNFKEIGVVKLTADDFSEARRDTAVLTHKANGFLVIEIYGNEEIIKLNEELIDDIINSIKFSKNNHDYSQDDSKGVLDKYRNEVESGETIKSGDTVI